MKLTTDDDHWSQVSAHCFAPDSNGAPWRVQLHVAALVGEHRIISAVARYTAEQPTVWDVRAVTDDARLIVVIIAFDAHGYDRDEETRTYPQHHPHPVVRQAWARSLRGVVQLDIRTAAQRLNHFGEHSDEFDVGDVHLLFTDGTEVSLGFDQSTIYDRHQRASTDALLDAIRRETGL